MKSAKATSLIILFAAVVFAGDRLVAVAARQILKRSRNPFVLMYEGRSPAEVLFLGDSRVDRNIDPRTAQELTGKRCLNLGLGGNSVRVSEALLEDYLERYDRPSRVIIELSHATADPEQLGEMRILSGYSPRIAKLARDIDPTFVFFESVFKSLRYNDPSFWRIGMEAFRAPESRLLGKTIPREIIQRWKDGPQIVRPILEKNMAALARIRLYVDAHQVPMEMIIGPSWIDFRRGISNFDLWKAALQSAAGPHLIRDYSDVFNDHPEYFNDEMHLNAAGAVAFVRRLVADHVL